MRASTGAALCLIAGAIDLAVINGVLGPAAIEPSTATSATVTAMALSIIKI